MSLNCKFLKWRGQTRTFSDHIPGYAQGAVFPDDEGGAICGEIGCPCPAEEAGNLAKCELAENSGLYCPDCLAEGFFRVEMLKLPDDRFYCPECEFEESKTDHLLERYRQNLDELLAQNDRFFRELAQYEKAAKTA